MRPRPALVLLAVLASSAASCDRLLAFGTSPGPGSDWRGEQAELGGGGDGGAPRPGWSTVFGGNALAIPVGVAADASSALYVATRLHGVVTFPGGEVVAGAGDADGLLLRYGATGTYQWSMPFKGDGVDRLSAIAAAPDGSAWVAGYSDRGLTGGCARSTNPTATLFVAHVTPVGSCAGIGGAGGLAEPLDIKVTSTRVFMTGYFTGTLSMVGCPDVTSEAGDIFLAALSSGDLSCQWLKRFGSSSPTQAGVGLAIHEASARLYLSAIFLGSLDFGGGPVGGHGDLDSAVVAFSLEGAHQWTREIGGPGKDLAGRVATDAAGNVYVAGTFARDVKVSGVTQVSGGGADALVASWKPDGSVRWVKRIGGPLQETGVAVTTGPTGVFVTGSYQSDLGATLAPDAGGRGLGFVLAIDSNGVQRWEASIGTGFATGTGAVTTPAGQLVVVGVASGTVPVDKALEPGATEGILDGIGFSQRYMATDGTLPTGARVDIGEGGSDVGRAIALGPDGSVVVSGGFGSRLEPFGSVVTKGGEDIFIGSLQPTATGSASFQTFGGRGRHRVNAILRDAAGATYLGGTFSGKLPFLAQPDAVDDRDGFVAKLDTYGQPVWAVIFGSNDNDEVTALALDGGGRICAAGWNELILKQPPVTTVFGEDDIFVACMAPDSGTIGWLGIFGGPDDDRAYALAAVGNSLVLAGAVSAGFPGVSMSASADEDAFVARLEPGGAGTISWLRRLGGTDDDAAQALATDGKAIYVGGRAEGPGTYESVPFQGAGDLDGFVLRIDAATGAPGWTRWLASKGADEVTAIALLPSGALVATGRLGAPADLGTGPLQHGGGADVLVASLGAAQGEVRRARLFGGPADDLGRAAVAAPPGQAYLTGSFQRQIDLGGGLKQSRGADDVFVLQFLP